MKKFLSVLLCLAMLFSFAACGEEPEPAELPTYSQGLNSDGFYDLKASDYITLPDLKNIEIPEEERVANKDTVQAQIDSLLSSYATKEHITDRAVKDGDGVNIDYSGSIDGVKFDGGTATGQSVIAGGTNFIDDFLDQIIDHMPGDTFDVNVTFPDPYQNNQDLAGKDAVFEVTINYIEETKTPTFTDEFVAENFKVAYGFETTTDVKDFISETVVENQITQWISNYLFDNSTCSEVPEAVIEHQKLCTKANFEDQAAYYQTDVTTLLSIMGYSDLDQMIEDNLESIEDMGKSALIYQAVAEQEKLNVTDSDLSAYFLTATGSADYSSSEEHYGLPYLKLMVLNYKVVDYVTEKAK